jgi:hypothetical protein
VSNFRYFEFKDGLPENNIKEFIVDNENGYWFRGSSNVIYFNGYEFTNFNISGKTFTLSNEEIFSFNLYENNIYVFGNTGIDIINCKTKESHLIFTYPNPLQIRAGFITSRGFMLAVVADGTIFKIQKDKLIKIGELSFYTQCTIRETKEGDVLISNDNRQILVLGSDLSLKNEIIFSSLDLIASGIYNTSDFGTVVAKNNEFCRFDSKSKSFELIKELSKPDRLFCESRKYYFTVSNFNRILQRDKYSKSVTEISVDLKTNFYINQINTDKYGTVILSTNQGIILFKEVNNYFQILPELKLTGADLSNTRRALLETSDHKILQITYKGIALYDPFRSVNQVLAVSDVNGYSGVLDDQLLWLGTDGQGLISFDIKKDVISGKVRYKGKGDDSIMHITAINKLNNRQLLVGTSLSKGSLKIFDINNHLFSDVVIKGWHGETLKEKVTSIIRGKYGGLWLCTNNGLIYLTDKLELKQWINKKNLGTDIVNHIYEEDATRIWIATDIGLIHYRLSDNFIIKKYNSDDGLAGNKCIAVIPDEYRTLWVPTFTGISRIDLKTEKAYNFYMYDGLSDNEYNYSSFLKTSSGNLYFGGLNGYTRIQPFPFYDAKDSSTSLSLDYILLNNRDGEKLLNTTLRDPLKFHFKNDHLSLHFSQKNQMFSEFVTYRYRIKGLSDTWIPLNRQNYITLDYVPYGNYVVQIQSIDLHNKRNVNQIELPLQVYHYFYESKIFYITLGLLVLGLVTFIFISRYNSLRKIGRLKADLSNDIHDEIGTIFTKAVMQLDVLNQVAGKSYPEINTIQRGLRDGIQRFRNVLWSLNTDNDKTDDFAARINTTISEIFAETQFDYSVRNNSQNIYFNKSIRIRRNLLLIIRELAHNTLKHSNGDLFEVVISKNAKKWIFEISDNGRNESDIITHAGIGLGLKSIQSRVVSMKGQFELKKNSQGFFIKIMI